MVRVFVIQVLLYLLHVWNQSFFTCGYNCQSFLLSLLPLCSCLLFLSSSQSKPSLGYFQEGRTRWWTKAMLCWGKDVWSSQDHSDLECSHRVTFYLNGIVTDVPDPVSPPMKWWYENCNNFLAQVQGLSIINQPPY